ncbi:hypothetical protein B0H19DRAFT_942658 [Mycena capillaripes]|nr:hypothetical protein B0H19DRAFT_942658 [Mycena capillaripes]
MFTNFLHSASPQESPFVRWLNTNYALTDAEIDDIRAHLVPFQAELMRLDVLISDLILQRQRVKDHIHAHMVLTSHLRRLPQEVIENIFLDCLPTHRNAIMSTSEAPLLLCRICSQWRSIAVSLPWLWASLHFDMYRRDKTPAVVKWLERSSAAPLLISLAELR